MATKAHTVYFGRPSLRRTQLLNQDVELRLGMWGDSERILLTVQAFLTHMQHGASSSDGRLASVGLPQNRIIHVQNLDNDALMMSISHTVFLAQSSALNVQPLFVGTAAVTAPVVGTKTKYTR